MLPKRANRGNRMALLVQQQRQEDEQREQQQQQLSSKKSGLKLANETNDDEMFWNQAFFQEDGGDDADKEFHDDDDDTDDKEEDEEEEDDEVDSDFFESESDDEEREKQARVVEMEITQNEKKQKRDRAKQTNKYVDPKLKAKPVGSSTVATSREKKRQREPATNEKEADEKKTSKRRKSNRVSVIRHREMVEKRLEIAEEKQAIRRVKRGKNKGEEVNKEPTQEEKLQEAMHITALYNRESLKKLVRMEEDRMQKQRESRLRRVYTGPVVRFRSCNEGNELTFTHVNHVPLAMNQKQRTLEELDPLESKTCIIYPEKAALYRDPLTKLPYSCVDAFQAIRNAFREYQVQQGSLPPQTAIISHHNSHTRYLLQFKESIIQQRR